MHKFGRGLEVILHILHLIYIYKFAKNVIKLSKKEKIAESFLKNFFLKGQMFIKVLYI